MRDLAATKAQRDLAFVTVIQEALDVAHLDVVVTIIGTGTELDFLDLDDLLLGLRFGSLLLLLVLELTVVHQTAHRRHSRGGNFNQVNVNLTGHAQGISQAHDTEGFVVRT